MDNTKKTNNNNEYLYFKCQNGHENYIFWDKQNREWNKKELVVECQHCEWKSAPFYPQLFQHSAQGNFLLWIYTTKDINAIQSVFNLQVEAAPNLVETKKEQIPSNMNFPQQKEKLATELQEIKNIEDADHAKSDPEKRHVQTVKIPRMSRQDLDGLDNIPIQPSVTPNIENSNILKEDFSLPITKEKIKKHSQTVKITRMDRNELGLNTADAKDKPPVEPITKEKIKKHSQTVKITRMDRNELGLNSLDNKDKPSVKPAEPSKNKKLAQTMKLPKMSRNQLDNNTVVNENKEKFDNITPLGKNALEDTLELSVKDLDLGEKGDTVEIKKPEIKQESVLTPVAYDKIKLQQNYFLFLILNFLWLFVVVAIVILAFHFFTEQNQGVQNALYSIKNEIGNIKFPEFPEINISNPSSEPVSEIEEKWKNEYKDLYKQHRELLTQLKEEKDKNVNTEKEMRALLVSYRDAQNKSSDLQRDMEKIRQEKFSLLREIAELNKKSSATSSVDVPILDVLPLTMDESDYYSPSISLDGKYMIFYRDEDAGRKKVRRHLNLAFITNGKITKLVNLFQSPVVKLKDREIPFVFDWNKSNKILLLTRVEGKNSIHQISLNVDVDAEAVRFNEKVLVSVQYPITLGPPALSPDQKYFACVYQKGDKSIVRIHDLLDGHVMHSISGGGDTLRSPLWSLDSRKLLFLENDHKGIVTWEFPGDKRIKNIPSEVYGRYLSLSPQGDRILFFTISPQGKGSVDICMWNWTNLQNPIETIVENVQTSETCQIQWLNDYFSFVKKGEKDEVIFTEYETKRQHTIFSKEGRINWMENVTSYMIFSYKEGLFTRPYLINVK